LSKLFRFTEDFIKHLEIYDEQKHKVLNSTYLIRNSLHNNGYAYHDFKITLRGKSYNFIKGKRIDLSGWDNLFIFFDELIYLLIKIARNTKVKDISLVPTTNIQES